MKRPVRTILAALLASTLVLLAGCSDTAGGSGASVQDGGVLAVLPAVDRKEPIELAGTTLAGERLDLASLRGQPVVLNIWGSWCGPCRIEADDLQEASVELAGEVNFVGLAIRDNLGNAQAYERRFKITYPSLLDTGDLLLQLRGAVSAQTPPITLVLDEQGRVAAKFVGPITQRTLIDMVEDVSRT